MPSVSSTPWYAPDVTRQGIFRHLERCATYGVDLTRATLRLDLLPTADLKRAAGRLAEEGGVTWVKQSNGWGKGRIATTAEAVKLLRDTVTCTRVEASGQLNSLEKALIRFEAGAELLGTSSAHRILDDEN